MPNIPPHLTKPSPFSAAGSQDKFGEQVRGLGWTEPGKEKGGLLLPIAEDR